MVKKTGGHVHLLCWLIRSNRSRAEVRSALAMLPFSVPDASPFTEPVCPFRVAGYLPSCTPVLSAHILMWPNRRPRAPMSSQPDARCWQKRRRNGPNIAERLTMNRPGKCSAWRTPCMHLHWRPCNAGRSGRVGWCKCTYLHCFLDSFLSTRFYALPFGRWTKKKNDTHQPCMSLRRKLVSRLGWTCLVGILPCNSLFFFST